MIKTNKAKPTSSNIPMVSNRTDANFMDRTKITCTCVNAYSYDESQYSNDSIPMSSDLESETMIQNPSLIESSYPPNIMVSESEKISESESESVSGISSDQESDESIMYTKTQNTTSGNGMGNMNGDMGNMPGMENMNGDMGNMPGMGNMNGNMGNMPGMGNMNGNMGNTAWSATETMKDMVMTEGSQINNHTFQVFVNEMIKDKCWEEKDLKDFMKSMQTIKDIVNTQNNDDILALLLNPTYFNVIHDILDKLDTINVVCAFGTGDKCTMISDPTNKARMQKQVLTITKLVDAYTPIFVRMLLLMESFTQKLSQEQACNLDPNYLETVKMMKERLIGTLYMRKIQNLDFASQNKALRDMSNGVNESQQIITEKFSNNCNSRSADNQYTDNLLIFLIFIVVGIIIYIIMSKSK